MLLHGYWGNDMTTTVHHNSSKISLMHGSQRLLPWPQKTKLNTTQTSGYCSSFTSYSVVEFSHHLLIEEMSLAKWLPFCLGPSTLTPHQRSHISFALLAVCATKSHDRKILLKNACYKEKILMEIYRDETCVLSNAATCSQSACRAVVTQCRLETVHMDMLQLE